MITLKELKELLKKNEEKNWVRGKISYHEYKGEMVHFMEMNCPNCDYWMNSFILEKYEKDYNGRIDYYTNYVRHCSRCGQKVRYPKDYYKEIKWND